MAQTKRMPLGEIKRLTTLALSTQGAAEQRNRTKTQKVWNCNSRYDPPPKLSPGPYWLWARKFCQDHNDVTPSLKVRRPQIMSRFIVALSCGQTLVLCSSCHKGVTLRNVFHFAWAQLQFPPRWTRQTLFSFYFSFCSSIHHYFFESIEEHCTTQLFLTTCRRKRQSSERWKPRGPILYQVDAQLDRCLPSSAFRTRKLTPRSL